MDPFALLGLEPRYQIDLGALERTYRDLSKALHPDRATVAAETSRRERANRASDVNDALRVLKDPVRRAEAFFTLFGVGVGEAHEPPPPSELLLEVLEEREALAEARASASRDALVEIRSRALAAKRSVEERFEQALVPGVARAELERLVPLLGELRYRTRFAEQADDACFEVTP